MTPREKGLYLVIEGTDGAGTTTQKELLKQHIAAMGRDVIDVAEPGGTPIGDALRHIVKDASLPRSPETNFDIFTICRRELAQQVISPALGRGTHVVSDRNWFSTFAYQGYGEGLDVSMITSKMQAALGKFFMPNFAAIIDVPVEVSEARMRIRGTSANDHFEQKGRKFFEMVREGYLRVSEMYHLPVIDGTMPIQDVHEEILATLSRRQQLDLLSQF